MRTVDVSLAFPVFIFALALVAVLGMLASILGMCGLFIVNPNEAKVLQLFGDYVGSAKEAGLRPVKVNVVLDAIGSFATSGEVVSGHGVPILDADC